MNTDSFHVFSRHDKDEAEFQRVLQVAQSLRTYIDSVEVKKKIAVANVHGKPSQEIQACIIDHAKVLGFQSEKKKLFSKYKTAALRPDYYLQLSAGRGIILEVERGKILANNMDLLDLWKCHICTEAQYLFLMVPMLRPAKNGKILKAFPKVVARMDSFFHKGNYTNVYGLFIFGF